MAILHYYALLLHYYYYAQFNARFCSNICSYSRKPTPNAGTQSYSREENVAHDNPTPEYMELESFQRPVQQPDAGFRNPHFDPGNHYQLLRNENERPDNVYGRLQVVL